MDADHKKSIIDTLPMLEAGWTNARGGKFNLNKHRVRLYSQTLDGFHLWVRVKELIDFGVPLGPDGEKLYYRVDPRAMSADQRERLKAEQEAQKREEQKLRQSELAAMTPTERDAHYAGQAEKRRASAEQRKQDLSKTLRELAESGLSYDEIAAKLAEQA